MFLCLCLYCLNENVNVTMIFTLSYVCVCVFVCLCLHMCIHVRTNVCSVRQAHKYFISSLPERLCLPRLLKSQTSVCLQSQTHKMSKMPHLIPYKMYKIVKLNGIFQHLMYPDDIYCSSKYMMHYITKCGSFIGQ